METRTREHVTLNYLHDTVNGPALTFPIPQVLYHRESGNRYYLITSRLPGETLEQAWPSMDEAAKETCVKRAAEIFKELASRENNKIGSVDGRDLADNWMRPPDASAGYAHEVLLRYCEDITMDCSAFVLHHCDMGPTNVIVDRANGCAVGLADFEMTGYVPKGWVRTKFGVCWAMDFDFTGDDIEKSREWRQRVQLQLGYDGFSEVAAAWKSRFNDIYSRT